MGEYLPTFWRRRRYKRLATASKGSKRSSWRIRIKLKFKLRYLNPKRLLIGLHDAYVRMMIRVANSRVVLTGGAVSTGYGVHAMSPFGMAPTKEYDDKMLIQMYNSIIGRSQLPGQRIIS
ncbi:hypothetical protein OSB04_022896 [Centaurea solstitialis]|uniref:Uncharacterized protein n=1 Tax=Centaurea solstitialis TaxID=347529 RepID=A0AA38SJS2_9ASTR|nr:hypothetical protein OSB04_022896 [Centaurea solstitialis]